MKNVVKVSSDRHNHEGKHYVGTCIQNYQLPLADMVALQFGLTCAFWGHADGVHVRNFEQNKKNLMVYFYVSDSYTVRQLEELKRLLATKLETYGVANRAVTVSPLSSERLH